MLVLHVIVGIFHYCPTEHPSRLFWPYCHLLPSRCSVLSPLFLSILTMESILPKKMGQGKSK